MAGKPRLTREAWAAMRAEKRTPLVIGEVERNAAFRTVVARSKWPEAIVALVDRWDASG